MYFAVNAWPVRILVTIGCRSFEIPFMKGKVTVWWVWETEDRGMLAGDMTLPSSSHAILRWLRPMPCYVAGPSMVPW